MLLLQFLNSSIFSVVALSSITALSPTLIQCYSLRVSPTLSFILPLLLLPFAWWFFGSGPEGSSSFQLLGPAEKKNPSFSLYVAALCFWWRAGEADAAWQSLCYCVTVSAYGWVWNARHPESRIWRPFTWDNNFCLIHSMIYISMFWKKKELKSKILKGQSRREKDRHGAKRRTSVHIYTPPYRKLHTPHGQGHASLIYHSNKHPFTPPLLSSAMHLLLSCTNAPDLQPLCSVAETGLIYSECCKSKMKRGKKKRRGWGLGF